MLLVPAASLGDTLINGADLRVLAGSGDEFGGAPVLMWLINWLRRGKEGRRTGWCEE